MKLQRVFPIAAMVLVVLMGSCNKDEYGNFQETDLTSGESLEKTSDALSSGLTPSDRLTVKCFRDAQKIFFDSWNQNTIEHKETVKMLLLNRANKVLGITTLSEGGLSGTVTDVRMIFQYAIKGNASGIILAHNHPSGNIHPSDSDQKITNKIKEACGKQGISRLVLLNEILKNHSTGMDQ